MIRFLNADSVAGYAHIGDALPTVLHPQSVPEDSVCFQRANRSVFLCPYEGMAILQLQQEKQTVYSYYLDKTVIIAPGVAFCVLPLDVPCAICMHTDGEIEPISTLPASPPEKQPTVYVDRIYTFFDQVQAPGFLFPGERHKPYELVCVLDGCLHNVVGGRAYPVMAQQAMLLPPDTWHTQYGEATQGVHFITVAFHSSSPLPTASLLRPFSLNHVSTALLREMIQDLTDETLQERRLLCGIQFLLTPWLLHCESEPTGGRAADALRQENQILDRSLEYIATHTQKKLTVEAVAKNCGVSIPYLSQLFRRHLKTSPGAYLQHVRLEQAGRMLRHGVGTVSEIANELHYSSSQHFCTAFKKQYGISPLQYAKTFSTIPVILD